MPLLPTTRFAVINLHQIHHYYLMVHRVLYFHFENVGVITLIPVGDTVLVGNAPLQ